MNGDRERANRRLTLRILAVAVAMFGFGYALVPLYNVFCEVTGLNGKTGGRAAATETYAVDPDRLVTVEFLATVNGGEPWTFRPAVARLQVHPGKSYVTHYLAANPTGRAVTVQAVPSVAPGLAAQHFHKTECFCFHRQDFAAGEAREMPLVFTIDPALPPEVGTVSLAYTLFELGETRAN